MIEHVDPFIGSAVTDLPVPQGLAETWWWPKPQVGNTHPGATYPFGMVSVCAYSGAYPTGYGLYQLNTEGVPSQLYDTQIASGFTHFQQSGTGAIRKYYNYFRVTPMLEPLDSLGSTWDLNEEYAEPGYYAATLGSGIGCELTVGPKSAVHRYTFPAHQDARLVIDFSLGGLAIPYGATVPLRAHLEAIGPGVAQAEIVVEGAPLAVHLECDAGDLAAAALVRPAADAGRHSPRLRPDPAHDAAALRVDVARADRAGPGAGAAIRFLAAWRRAGEAQSRMLTADRAPTAFDSRRAETATVWRQHLDKIKIETASTTRQTIFSTALYHSLIKPCFAPEESPFWPSDGPFVFDICTMWDIYRTQLPLITALFPARAVELANALLTICEEEGNLPIGYRMAKGADRFTRQASALAHTFLADLCELGLPGIDWDWALCHMDTDLRRSYGEDYLLRGLAEPITHTLDLAFGYQCTAKVARYVGDNQLADPVRTPGRPVDQRLRSSRRPACGLDVLRGRQVELLVPAAARHAGADRAGWRRTPVRRAAGSVLRLRRRPGQAAGRTPERRGPGGGVRAEPLRGLNNEPDMEAPWAYHYAGRPDRTAEVVHAAVNNMFGLGRGGLPGNDDSGGLSSWYVWASLGLFPVAGQSLYLLNAPSFAESRIAFAGEELVIKAPGFVEPVAGGPVQYVQTGNFQRRDAESDLADGSGVAPRRAP